MTASLSDILDADSFDATFAAVRDFLDARGRESALHDAIDWCLSQDEAVRAAGLDLLGVLVIDDLALLPELLHQVGRVSDQADSEDLRWSAVHAVSGHRDARVLPELLRFQRDTDPDVRWQVAYGLPDAAGDSAESDHPAVRALLLLLEDSDAGVRDWAAFGLGVKLDVDSPAIRDALFVLARNRAEDASGEAAVALARRGDERVLPLIEAALEEEHPGNLWVEAAAAAANPRFSSKLRRLREVGWARRDVRGYLLAEALKRTPGAASST